MLFLRGRGFCFSLQMLYSDLNSICYKLFLSSYISYHPNLLTFLHYLVEMIILMIKKYCCVLFKSYFIIRGHGPHSFLLALFLKKCIVEVFGLAHVISVPLYVCTTHFFPVLPYHNNNLPPMQCLLLITPSYSAS